MPSITLELVKTSKEKKAHMAQEITRIASEETGIPAEAFYIFFKENEPENVAVGGTLLSELKRSES